MPFIIARSRRSSFPGWFNEELLRYLGRPHKECTNSDFTVQDPDGAVLMLHCRPVVSGLLRIKSFQDTLNRHIVPRDIVDHLLSVPLEGSGQPHPLSKEKRNLIPVIDSGELIIAEFFLKPGERKWTMSRLDDAEFFPAGKILVFTSSFEAEEPMAVPFPSLACSMS